MSADTGYLQQRVGRRLLAWRTAHGWSQDTAAEVLGICRPYLSNLEHGHRNIGLKMVERIASVLGVPAVDLLTEREDTA